MQTSRFQLGLIATLAIGLGFSLASSEAIGYPAGAAISKGANPVWSTGGDATRSSTSSVFTAPADQDVVVTDIGIDFKVKDPTCMMTVVATFKIEGSDTVLSKRSVSMNWWSNSYAGQGQTFDVAMNSGLRLPAGETLSLVTSSELWDSCESGARTNDLVYTLSGYYAQP